MTLDADAHEAISLDRLSDAFAAAMGKADAAVTDSAENANSPVLPAEPASSDDSADINPASVLEAMLFVGHPENLPLTAPHAAGLMRGVEPEEIHDLVTELNRRYEFSGCPYHIASEGAGYRLLLREEFHRLRNKFYGRVRAARLSQAAIEVLSLIAYEQPMTRDNVDRIRGIGSGAILRQLVRRRLLRIERTDAQPRETLYYTTGRFLQLLGLENLEELPQAMDLERR